jgi:hypothetical protein
MTSAHTIRWTRRTAPWGALLATILGIGLFGCGATDSTRRAPGDRNRITAEQVREVVPQYSTAYGIVETLRPLWLRKRGRTSIANESAVAVYVDGARYGPPASLRDIPASSVDAMRFLPSAEATNRYGTGHVHGIIMVYTKR